MVTGSTLALASIPGSTRVPPRRRRMGQVEAGPWTSRVGKAGALSEAEGASRLRELPSRVFSAFVRGISTDAAEKSVSAGRRNQHARRACYPEFTAPPDLRHHRVPAPGICFDARIWMFFWKRRVVRTLPSKTTDAEWIHDSQTWLPLRIERRWLGGKNLICYQFAIFNACDGNRAKHILANLA